MRHMATASALAGALVAHRDEHGLSQKKLAARVGVSQNAVQRWEQGGSVRPSHIPALARELGVDPARIRSMCFADTDVEDEQDISDRLLRIESRNEEIAGQIDTLVAQFAGLQEQLEMLVGGGDDEIEDGDPRRN